MPRQQTEAGKMISKQRLEYWAQVNRIQQVLEHGLNTTLETRHVQGFVKWAPVVREGKASDRQLVELWTRFQQQMPAPSQEPRPGGPRRKQLIQAEVVSPDVSNGDVAKSHLLAAKGLIDQIGGIPQVRDVLDLIEQLQT